jgi:DNA mismatch endonuclease (patch repair protein)
MGKANRGRDTGPEVRLRSELHGRGLRFRVNRRVEAGVRTTVDIVFPRERVAVYVDGCFWHQCPEHGTRPKTNGGWWSDKLDGNVARDRRNEAALAARGWQVIRVWEHEDVDTAAELIEAVVRGRRGRSTASAWKRDCR